MAVGFCPSTHFETRSLLPCLYSKPHDRCQRRTQPRRAIAFFIYTSRGLSRVFVRKIRRNNSVGGDVIVKYAEGEEEGRNDSAEPV